MFKFPLRFSSNLALVSCLAVVGCSSDDKKGPSAQDQCEMLADAMCDRLVTCANELTGEKLGATDRNDCVESVTSASDCSKAVSVSSDYDECSDRIRSASCDDVWSVDDDGTLEVNGLPPVCEGVILTK
jgi:hypothetical protein